MTIWQQQQQQQQPTSTIETRKRTNLFVFLFPATAWLLLFFIVPEKAEIQPSGYTDEPCLLGTVEEAVYIGTDTRYVIRLTEQSSIVVRTQNLHRRNLHRYASGETVQVLVSPDSIRILEEDMSAYEGYVRTIAKETEPQNTIASV